MTLNKQSYLVQLDGLRFIAVGLVLVDHWLAEYNTIPFGPLGVTLFFVLSGFLITRILINSSEKYKGSEKGMKEYLRKFFVRRTLRIFPVYYLSIFALWLMDVPPVRDTLVWCVLYATNIYIAVNQHWMGVIDHFWSLAVEEQFYIFFPFVIFLIPRHRLVAFLVGIIIFSVGLRAYFFLAGYDWVVPYVTMPACLDSFGLGGLMAWMQLKRPDLFKTIFSKSYLILLGLAGWIVVVYWSKMLPEKYNVANVVIDRFVSSLFCFFLIGKAVLGFGGPMKWFLEHPVSLYFGKISYGLYVYHNFVYNHFHTPVNHPTLRGLRKIYSYIPSLTGNQLFEILYFFVLTTAVASISWYFVEKPINNLKERYAG